MTAVEQHSAPLGERAAAFLVGAGELLGLEPGQVGHLTRETAAPYFQGLIERLGGIVPDDWDKQRRLEHRLDIATVTALSKGDTSPRRFARLGFQGVRAEHVDALLVATQARLQKLSHLLMPQSPVSEAPAVERPKPTHSPPARPSEPEAKPPEPPPAPVLAAPVLLGRSLVPAPSDDEEVPFILRPADLYVELSTDWLSFLDPHLLSTDEAEWQERALCAQTDPEAFFPEKGCSTREAKRICQGCEVRVDCLEHALSNDERFGIWGGLSERERRKLKKKV